MDPSSSTSVSSWFWLLWGQFGSYYAAYFAAYLGAIVAAALTLRWLRGRLSPHVRRACAVALVVLGVRLALFDNPLAFRVYQFVHTAESIGMRQWGMLDLEARKYRRHFNHPTLPNLAVGSSQVGAIFNHWPRPSAEPLGVYSLAGMKPLDYVLNQDGIAAEHPARVILYLSAFDMTGSPELFSLPLAPSRPWAMWSIIQSLRDAGLTDEELAPTIRQFVASQLLPEYRYSFVFRGLLKRWAPMPPAPAAEVASEATASARRLTEFSTYYDQQWLRYNFIFLDQFLAFCETRGIEVVIAEGQVNPAAVTPTIAAMNRHVRERLMGYASEFTNVRYLPATDVYEFVPAEYHDFTHVLPAAAAVYSARMVEVLQGQSLSARSVGGP